MDIRTVSFYRAAYKSDDFPRDRRPQFAFVGRSNVGKSSVINAILRNKKIARVSQTPGKTQAIHFYLINEKFYLVDLPGYGYAKVPRPMAASWGDLARSYFESASALRVIFLLLDSRRLPSQHDLQMHDWMEAAGVRWRAVFTKVDKLSNNELAENRRAAFKLLDVEPASCIDFSRMTGAGVEQIWSSIETELRTSRRSRDSEGEGSQNRDDAG